MYAGQYKSIPSIMWCYLGHPMLDSIRSSGECSLAVGSQRGKLAADAAVLSGTGVLILLRFSC